MARVEIVNYPPPAPLPQGADDPILFLPLPVRRERVKASKRGTPRLEPLGVRVRRSGRRSTDEVNCEQPPHPALSRSTGRGKIARVSSFRKSVGSSFTRGEGGRGTRG